MNEFEGVDIEKSNSLTSLISRQILECVIIMLSYLLRQKQYISLDQFNSKSPDAKTRQNVTDTFGYSPKDRFNFSQMHEGFVKILCGSKIIAGHVAK